MATIKKEVEVCDICENQTNGFYYWENTTSPFGPVSESTLIIDICKDCANTIRFNIPNNMMLERYGSETADEAEVLNNIEEWKKICIAEH